MNGYINMETIAFCNLVVIDPQLMLSTVKGTFAIEISR